MYKFNIPTKDFLALNNIVSVKEYLQKKRSQFFPSTANHSNFADFEILLLLMNFYVKQYFSPEEFLAICKYIGSIGKDHLSADLLKFFTQMGKLSGKTFWTDLSVTKDTFVDSWLLFVKMEKEFFVDYKNYIEWGNIPIIKRSEREDFAFAEIENIPVASENIDKLSDIVVKACQTTVKGEISLDEMAFVTSYIYIRALTSNLSRKFAPKVWDAIEAGQDIVYAMRYSVSEIDSRLEKIEQFSLNKK